MIPSTYVLQMYEYVQYVKFLGRASEPQRTPQCPLVVVPIYSEISKCASYAQVSNVNVFAWLGIMPLIRNGYIRGLTVAKRDEEGWTF